MLNILPGLDAADQGEAAQHIANLSEETSVRRWTAMLVAGQLPPSAADVLFNDLLNRPHELAMPALADMADKPSHPKNQESIQILDVLYGQPPQGTQWSEWVKSKLRQEQP